MLTPASHSSAGHVFTPVLVQQSAESGYSSTTGRTIDAHLVPALDGVLVK